MSDPAGPRAVAPIQVVAAGHPRHGTRSDLARVGVPRTPPGAIERDRLTQRLANHVPLAVLRAPSGFGKTVAVAQWLNDPAGPEGAAVWIRADSSLNAAAFWTELAGLLAEAGVRVPRTDGLTHRDVESSVRRFGRPLIIVVDGYDELSAAAAVESQLIDMARYCRNLRVIVCLRSSRSFPNSLRVTIDTTLIESPELAFTPEEIFLLNPGHPRLPDDWAANLHRCTGGWPEPTRAVLLALQDDPHQAIEGVATTVAREYLATRVLPRFHHNSWLEFVFLIAMPEMLTDDVARYITGDTLARRRLERLETAGMLTAHEHRGRRFYRWPEAARNALREEFARRHPEDTAALHLRLARWYLGDGDAVSAARHALRAEDQKLLLMIVEEFWGPLLHRDAGTLDEAFAAIPTEAILASPRATAARDIRMHLLGAVTDAAVLSMADPLPTEERLLKALANSRAAHTALHTALSMTVATRVRGLAEYALDYARRCEMIGRFAIARRPKEVGGLLPSAMLQVGITRMIFGELPSAEPTLRLAYQASAGHVDGYIRRDAAGKLALLHALHGDSAGSEAWLQRHDHAGATPGRLTPAIERSAVLARALVAIDRLQPEQLTPLIPLIDQELTEEQSWRAFRAYVHARRCLIWGDRRSALQLLDDEGPSVTSPQAQSAMGTLLTAARIDLLLSLGLGVRAQAVLDASPRHPTLQPGAARLALLAGDEAAANIAMADDNSHPPGQRSELLLLSAIARHRQGDATGAADALVAALQSTREARSVLPFAMVPRDELRCVAQAVPDALALLESEPLRSTPGPFGLAVSLIKLTDRERRVLGRIADGGTLQEIAAELFVSYNTVKSQVRSLYTKLGANSRSAALTNAARHGLLAVPGADRK